ncbi:MAG: cytidylate kinase-like family protein [Clostridiales bacterium]|nr:cytidylate kinase-like family protein [Clostridiales bacterium]
MDKQIIISISREYGSGGHAIAEMLSKRFGIPLYDSNLLEIIATEKNVDKDSLKAYDEVPRVRLFSRRVKGQTNSLEENVANLQFDFLKKKAAAGESFVVVGRCSESVLKDYSCMVSIFVLGNKEAKIKRIMGLYNLSEDDALDKIERENFRRKMYHNYYCKGKWGDSRNYDLSINDSILGLDKTADIIEEYVRKRIELMA